VYSSWSGHGNNRDPTAKLHLTDLCTYSQSMTLNDPSLLDASIKGGLLPSIVLSSIYICTVHVRYSGTLNDMCHQLVYKVSQSHYSVFRVMFPVWSLPSNSYMYYIEEETMLYNQNLVSIPASFFFYFFFLAHVQIIHIMYMGGWDMEKLSTKNQSYTIGTHLLYDECYICRTKLINFQ
jgi:hypothetical protein